MLFNIAFGDKTALLPFLSHMSAMNSCRNCLSNRVTISENGVIAPFFLSRVIGCPQVIVLPISDQLRSKIQSVFPKPFQGVLLVLLRIISRLPIISCILEWKSEAYFRMQTRIRVCHECGYVASDHEYTEEQLAGLYADYRSSKYNSDRLQYEPAYSNIMHTVGKSLEEVESRVDNVDNILRRHVDFSTISTVLDWGGERRSFHSVCFEEKECHNTGYSSRSDFLRSLYLYAVSCP